MKTGRKKKENKLRSLIYANKHFTPYHISDQKNTQLQKKERGLSLASSSYFLVPISVDFGFSP